MPNSFPCLAPPPHNDTCCECIANALNERYVEAIDDLNFTNLNEQIPSYEQVMRGAKTWLLTNIPTSSFTVKYYSLFYLMVYRIKMLKCRLLIQQLLPIILIN